MVLHGIITQTLLVVEGYSRMGGNGGNSQGSGGDAQTPGGGGGARDSDGGARGEVWVVVT